MNTIKALIQQEHKDSDKYVLMSLIRFTDLKDVVLFTCKANPRNSSTDNYSSFVKENYEYYQRRVDTSRIIQIEQFIRNCILSEHYGYSITSLFPTSLILAVNEDDGNKIDCTGDACELELCNNIFIVDGQHRLMAMKSLYEKLDRQIVLSDEDEVVYHFLKAYKFNCVLLVNYDLWEQGQVFVNVNFKQKPVNKSLYYEVFGSQYNEDPKMWKQNHVYLAHSLTKVLNENVKSPYYERIRMIGTGKGYVSQAFFVEALIRQFSINGIWSIYKESNGRQGDVKHMAVELLSFFTAVKDAFADYWPSMEEEKGRIICKTTGTGAFVRLMTDVRAAASEDIIDSLYLNEISVSNKYYNFALSIFRRLSKSKAQQLFGPDAKFAGNSGKGAEVKMYKELRSELFSQNNKIFTSTINLPLTLDEVAAQLQEYLWLNVQDDLDCLGYRYDFDELSELEVENSCEFEHFYELKVNFVSGVTIYMSNEDNTGVRMSFPTSVSIKMERLFDKWVINEDSLRFKFDTQKYYM